MNELLCSRLHGGRSMREEDREAYKQRFPMHNLTVIGNTVRLYIEHSQWYFRFDEHDGKDGAIKTAQAKRDSFPASKIHTVYDNDKVRPTGVTGIRGIQQYHNSKNGEFLGYLARWQEGAIGKGRRKQKSKHFRFDKYPDPLQVAIDYREKQIAKNSLSEHNAWFSRAAEGGVGWRGVAPERTGTICYASMPRTLSIF